MAIKYSKLDPLNETVYQRINKRGDYQCLAVTRLFKYAERTNMTQHRLAVLKDKAAQIKQSRNIETHRLLRVQRYLHIPCLIIEDQGENDIVDGHHRYVMAYLSNRQFLPTYIFPPVIWKQYLVKDVPKKTAEQILSSGSGIR